VARPRGSWAGLPGLAYLPDPGPSPKGLGMVDATAAWDGILGIPAASITGTWSAGILSMGLSATETFTSGSQTVSKASLGIIYPLAADSFLKMGLGGRISIEADSNSLNVEGNFLFPLTLSPTGVDNAAAILPLGGLVPGLSLAWTAGGSQPRVGLELGAGTSLGTGAWLLGLSAKTGLSGIEVLAPSWAGLDWLVEGRLVIGPSPLTVSAFVAGRMESLSLPQGLSAGLGLGLWF